MEAARKENNEQYNTVLRKVRFIIPLTKGLLIPPPRSRSYIGLHINRKRHRINETNAVNSIINNIFHSL